jgi:ferrochelatase
MRYWSPLTEQTAAEVAAFAPEEIVLLPLYPQFSTTTTESSLKAWREAYAGPGASRLSAAIRKLRAGSKPRPRRAGEACGGRRSPRPRPVLRPRHPRKPDREEGRPLSGQVEITCVAIAAAAGLGEREVDWTICYPEPGRADEMAWPVDA